MKTMAKVRDLRSPIHECFPMMDVCVGDFIWTDLSFGDFRFRGQITEIDDDTLTLRITNGFGDFSNIIHTKITNCWVE